MEVNLVVKSCMWTLELSEWLANFLIHSWQPYSNKIEKIWAWHTKDFVAVYFMQLKKGKYLVLHYGMQ